MTLACCVTLIPESSPVNCSGVMPFGLVMEFYQMVSNSIHKEMITIKMNTLADLGGV